MEHFSRSRSKCKEQLKQKNVYLHGLSSLLRGPNLLIIISIYSRAVWPEKNRQMSLKLPKNDCKMPKNVRDLDKLIVAKGFKKSNKSPNLVTLLKSCMCWIHTLVAFTNLGKWTLIEQYLTVLKKSDESNPTGHTVIFWLKLPTSYYNAWNEKYLATVHACDLLKLARLKH